MLSFRCACVVLSLLTLPSARLRADAATPEYTEAVELGVQEFEEKNFLEARSHLARAHALYPNARTFRALGMVEFELKNYADSARYLEDALTTHEKPLDADKRAQAEALLARAKGYLAFLTLDIAPDTQVNVDGSRTDLSSGEQLMLTLGQHTLEFQAPGRIAQKRTINIKGGEQQTLRVTLAPLAAGGDSKGPLAEGERRPIYKNPWLWTAVGVVVAGAAAGTAVALTRDPGSRTGPVDNGTGGKRALVGPAE